MVKKIELFNISKHRAEYMGVAMIIIILFHVSLPRTDAFYGLRRMGNLGVDIFLFLSGIGLWFSWAKSATAIDGAASTVREFGRQWALFYWRRLRRIYPVWLIMASLYYVPRYIEKGICDLAATVDLLGDVLINWDFWLHDELTFWYVPATMMLYIFAPPYMQLIRRHPVYRWLVVLMVAWCIMVQYVAPIHQAVGHIEIFWSRVPIFFLGINIGEAVRQRRTIDGEAIWMILTMFVMTLGACIWLEQELHGKFPLFLERMLYIPLAVSTVLLLGEVFRRSTPLVNRIFAWVGGISLEVYLVHVEFVMKPIEHHHLGYWPTFLLTAAISLPAAWLLNYCITKVTGKK